MALPSTQVWEVRQAGASTNGGGFDPSVTSPGTDYSIQDAAQVVYTDLVIGGTTTNLTSVSTPFTSAHVGNTIQIASGTGFTTGFYSIRSVSGGVATMDRSVGTTASTGGVGSLGGALSSPALLASVAVGSNIIYVKYSATPITLTTSLTFSQAGFSFVGYDTNRILSNVDANRPTFRAGANNLTLFNCNSLFRWSNIQFDNPANAFTGLVALQPGGNSLVQNCKFSNYQNWAFRVDGGTQIVDCEVVSCGSSNIAIYVNGAGSLVRVIARSCTSTGSGVFFVAVAGVTLIDCIAYGTTGNVGVFVGPGYFQGCVAHSNVAGSSSDGFKNNTSASSTYERCVSYNNAGYGFNATGSAIGISRMSRCYTGANTLGGVNASAIIAANQYASGTLTGDPCTNAAGFDFSLNNIAGAALKALTVPLASGVTVGYPDAGVAQSIGGTTTNIILHRRRKVI